MSNLKPVGSEPALLLTKGRERVLVVGDLHIGWEVTLAQQGIHIPSQTGRMLERLKSAVNQVSPTRIIFLGDVKHTVAGVELEEWRDVPEFFESLVKLVPKVQVVVGNHDGNLEPLTPKQVELLPSTGVSLWGRFGLLHGHAWPSPEILGCKVLILGHLHPTVTLHDPLGYWLTRPVWVNATCDVKKLIPGTLKTAGLAPKGNLEDTLAERFHVKPAVNRCVFIPPFNDFLGGRSINKGSIYGKHGGEPLGPFLRSGAINMDEAEVHLLDGTYLGRVKQLRGFS